MPEEKTLTDEVWASALATKLSQELEHSPDDATRAWIAGEAAGIRDLLGDGLTREEAVAETRKKLGLEYDEHVYEKRASAHYDHEWDDGYMDGEYRVRTCQLCGTTRPLLRLRDLKDALFHGKAKTDNKITLTCPEKIVREVVRRLEKKEETP